MNNFDLKNKMAIVTGGAQGFGYDIAKKFINSGAQVRIWDNDETELKNVIKKEKNDKLSYDVVDVTDFDSVNQTIKNLENSKIDILINNAGITGPTAELWNYSVDEWNKVINVNLNGTYICCKLIVPLMIKNNYGRIVNIASVSGKDGNANASAQCKLLEHADAACSWVYANVCSYALFGSICTCAIDIVTLKTKVFCSS